MKQPHKNILIQHSLDKADQALRTAEDSLDKDLLNSQNRAYYAVFYAVLGLAYLEDFSTGKHHQLMGWFNKKYVHENQIFDKSFSRIYSNLLLKRERFDYDVMKTPTREETCKDLDDAKLFVNTLKTYILQRTQ